MKFTTVMAWLKARLTNSWMANQDYGWFMAHSGWAGIIMLSTSLLTSVHVSWMLWVTLGGIVAAAIKEYGYDANFELPKQTFSDNTQDFLGYCAGIAIAWAVTGVGLATHLLKAH